PGAGYTSVSTMLLPGDRLFLVSDGVTECPDASGAELGSDGLATMLRQSAHLPSSALLEALLWDLSVHAGGEVFPDDVSGLMFDYIGAG
ncbi:MAG: SpoIIE family protein phosphatase, partial [Paracoccaceae bacterium]